MKNAALVIASALCALAAVMVSGCYATNPPPPDCNPQIEQCNPADYPPLATVPTCAEACAHVEDPTPRGLGCQTDHSCFENCQRLKAARSPTFRKCIRDARSCPDVSACDR